MTWAEAIESPYLNDVRFKIELNEYGQLVMTSRTNIQCFFRSTIGALLMKQKTSGAWLLNCCILTAKNVKVVDVFWMSSNFVEAHRFSAEFETPFKCAPDLCVEVVFPAEYPA